MIEPTQTRCPEAPDGDNSTHHLAPTGGRQSCMRCVSCGQDEKSLREANLD